MDSSASTSSLSARTMPLVAILRLELRTLAASWLVRLWLVGAVLVTLLMLAGGWGTTKTAVLIATLLSPYLIFPWGVVVMILGISPVTGSRLEALADGILSRPITRIEYLLGAWAARVVIVLVVFFGVTVPAVCLVVFADRPAPADPVTFYGVAGSLGVVGLVLAFFVSLGFMTGIVLRRPLLASVILVLVWLTANVVLHAFSLEEFSTISLDQALPTLARTPWRTDEADDAGRAGDAADAGAGVEETARALRILLGEPKRPPGFYEQGDYSDTSLARVAACYSLLTLLALGAAASCFCWRDL